MALLKLSCNVCAQTERAQLLGRVAELTGKALQNEQLIGEVNSSFVFLFCSFVCLPQLEAVPTSVQS